MILTYCLAMFPFPPTSFFLHWLNQPEVIIHNEHFQKQSLHSRYYILNSQGHQRLSIPVRHPLVGKTLFEVEIDNQMPWQRNHWRSLEAAYRQSIYFGQYEEALQLLFNKKYSKLIDLTADCLTFCLNCVKNSHAEIKYVSDIVPQGQNLLQMGIITSRKAVASALPLPFDYVTVFGKAFDNKTSVLDALFCAGPHYLMQSAREMAEFVSK